jgi:hypothetical protein
VAAAVPFLEGAVFDPTATHAMGEAFDCACRLLHDIGELDNALKQVIAKRIIEVARGGERNPNKLCEHALQALGFLHKALGDGAARVPATQHVGKVL